MNIAWKKYFIIVGCAMAAPFVEAVPIQWDSAVGGNNNSYEVIFSGEISWTDASNQANLLGGHLATVTSEEENNFIFGLVNESTYWQQDCCNSFGPWLGGFQSSSGLEPAQGWSWVTGEAWVWDNWTSGEPNQWSGFEEDYLHYYNPGTGAFASTWNDFPDIGQPGMGAPVIAYVVEYESSTTTVPEPSTLLLSCLGLAGLYYRGIAKKRS